MLSCNTYHLTWVSLTLDVRYLLTAAPPDLECGVAPLGHPAPMQPLLVGRGVAPPGRCLWPQAGVAPLGCALHALTAARALHGWNVRSMNQGKLEVVKQEMARVNVNILGISKLKWTGVGEFNSDDHYIYCCGKESLRRKGVAIMVYKRVQNTVLG